MGLKLSSTVFGTEVVITRSGEDGKIVGFCQHQRNKQKQFYVQYTNGLGCACEGWFFEDELTVQI